VSVELVLQVFGGTLYVLAMLAACVVAEVYRSV
jgi:hypothetical protein